MDLGILMTPGFSKEVGVMYDHTVLNSMVQRGREREWRWMGGFV